MCFAHKHNNKFGRQLQDKRLETYLDFFILLTSFLQSKERHGIQRDLPLSLAYLKISLKVALTLQACGFEGCLRALNLDLKVLEQEYFCRLGAPALA